MFCRNAAGSWGSFNVFSWSLHRSMAADVQEIPNFLWIASNSCSQPSCPNDSQVSVGLQCGNVFLPWSPFSVTMLGGSCLQGWLPGYHGYLPAVPQVLSALSTSSFTLLFLLNVLCSCTLSGSGNKIKIKKSKSLGLKGCNLKVICSFVTW